MQNPKVAQLCLQLKRTFIFSTLVFLSEASLFAVDEVRIDGSSTVGPLSEAVSEEFQKAPANKSVRAPVGQSGTGGGFDKFVKREIDINGASRPIKAKEIDKAKAANLEYLELKVAYDGIAVVARKGSPIKELTMDELKKVWEPKADEKKPHAITQWKQLRADLPAKPVKLYGPGTASGTFDFFTEKVVGKEGSSRSDYTASEDDNSLVTGVALDEFAIGYFGFAYYLSNKSKLDLVTLVTKDKKKVSPSVETITSGEYPLARPLYIYVSADAVKKDYVKKYVEFYLNECKKLVTEVGYVAMTDKEYAAEKVKFENWSKSVLSGTSKK